jgi:hypothetical protein
MREEKIEKEQRQTNNALESTDIFLLKNSSCSRRRAHKSLQSVVCLALVTLSIFSFIIYLPIPTAHAYTADNYSGLVKCSGVTIQQLTQGQQSSTEVACSFQTLISMIGTTINWLFVIAIPVAVVLFAWAGLLYISGKDDNKKKAKNIFLNVAIGFIIMLVMFVVVKTVVGWVVDPSFGATTFLGS